MASHPGPPARETIEADSQYYYEDRVLRRAFREAYALASPLSLLALVGAAAGIAAAWGAPLLLLYGACFLGVAGDGAPVPGSPPACLARVPDWGQFWHTAWPPLFALAGGLHGVLRRWPGRGAAHVALGRLVWHKASLVAALLGVLLYGLLAWAWRVGELLRSGLPLWLLAGPGLALWLTGLENGLLRWLSRPTWEGLLLATVRMWLPRQFGPQAGTPRAVGCHAATGLLSVETQLDAADAQRAGDLILRALPGVASVRILDREGRWHTAGQEAQREGAKQLGAVLAAQRARRELARLRATARQGLAPGAGGLPGAPGPSPASRAAAPPAAPGWLAWAAVLGVGAGLAVLVWWLYRQGTYALRAEDLKAFLQHLSP